VVASDVCDGGPINDEADDAHHTDRLNETNFLKRATLERPVARRKTGSSVITMTAGAIGILDAALLTAGRGDLQKVDPL